MSYEKTSSFYENISYNVVVNTNTVNKQANTHTHAHKTIYVSQLKLYKLKT